MKLFFHRNSQHRALGCFCGPADPAGFAARLNRLVLQGL
jgi:hypothetical protein